LRKSTRDWLRDSTEVPDADEELGAAEEPEGEEEAAPDCWAEDNADEEEDAPGCG
jgi:hypothetical protein